MREIKFRGKAKMSVEELDKLQIEHTDGWVFGSLITNNGSPYIVGDIADQGDEYIAHEWWVAVDSETVGQFINTVDIMSREVYEGDVLFHDEGDFSFTAQVKHGGYEWYLDTISPIDCYSFDDFYEDESVDASVIGNIHDNPELLEVQP
ncbi:YopX family protein [Mammaliicoccus sciuri]